MDREIPKEVRNKERNKKIIRFSAIGIIGIVGISLLISLLRTGVQKKDLVLSTVDKGTIEVSVSASGKVVPAFEEIINSPINTRIVEVYRKGGDSVDVGTPILKLDLQSTETDYKKLLDEEQMKRYKLDQAKVNSQTKLSDMAMQIKVSEMKLARMKVELRNEQYLDSLGAGTTDKVRQAELSYNTSRLELEQLKQQYANEKQIAAADLKVLELDLNMFRKGLAEMKRTLDDAQIRSPRKAILTYINNQIGAQIPQGGQVAIISDLSHFKVDGEIADTYGDRVAAGGKAIVKVGSEKLEGTVSSVTPLSKNGVISFSVQLKEDNNKRAFGVIDQFGGSLYRFFVCIGNRNIAADKLLLRRLVFCFFNLRILGKVEYHRTGTTTTGNVESTCYRPGYVFGTANLIAPFSDWLSDTYEIDFLKSVCSKKACSHLSCNDNDRRTVYHCICNTCDRIGCSGAACHQANTDFTRYTGVALCRMGSSLFMANQDMVQCILMVVQGIERRHDGTAGITENGSHSLMFQRTHHCLCACY